MNPFPLKNISALLTSFFLVSCAFQSKEKPTPATQSQETETVAKTDEVKVYPVSHATAVLDWGGTIIYIDPVGDPDAFQSHPSPDLILITDIHGDHYSLETLEALDTEKAKLIVPKAVAELIPEAFAAQIDVLDNGETKERFDIAVTAIPMYNLRPEAQKFHVPGRGNGYVLEKDGMRIYFSGDTEDIPEMRDLKDIDKAFVCMNLPYTMTVERAADAVMAFAPKEVYPYHYRGNPDVSDVARFAAILGESNSDIRVVQLDWYPSAPY